LTTSNLTSSSVDLSRLQVNTARRYCLSLTTDTATTVSLTGRNFTGLDLTGAPSTRTATALTIQLQPGHTQAVLAPHGQPAALGAPAPPGKPGPP